MAKTLFLIDGHAQTYRAFYAIDGLTAPDGRPTNAAYGFARTILDTIKRHEPDYLAVAFDAPGPTFRHERYDQYKATRKPTPQELLDQIPIIMEILEAMRIPVHLHEGYEADDVLATLIEQARAHDLEAVLVSSDKDLGQLLAPDVRMYDPRKDEMTDADAFAEKKGYPPALLPDVMGLWGDTSDNIPGVPGIGEKGAAKLIAAYGDLDEVLAHADAIKGKRGESLRAHAEDARLSRELATIARNAPVTLDLEACRHHEPDLERLLTLYDELGFTSLKRDLGDPATQRKVLQAARDYRLVNTPALFEEFLADLRKVQHIAVDTETTSTDPMQADLVGISFAWSPETAYYLPFRAPEGETVLGADALEALGEVLADPAITKTGHNLKYDALVLRRAGLALQGIDFDSMLASHLVNGHLRGHSLDAAAERHLGLATIPISDLIGKGRNQKRMDEAPLDRVTDYAAEDADVALRLEPPLREALNEKNLQGLLDELELPLNEVLTEMQATGIRLDTECLASMSGDMDRQLERLTEEIHYLAGREFNIASPKQLSALLFDELDFPVIRKTKTSRSTDEAVLQELAHLDHPKRSLPKRVLEHRMYTKLKNTYIDALPQLVHPETGRLHTTFHQTGTATGRLSSSDPNLQNIPVRTEEGRGIRAAFVPAEGWVLIAADYSQVELRVLAHDSGDPALREAFEAGEDIHRAVAAAVFDVDPDAVTADQRRAAKAINFGIVYGQSAFGLSRTTGMARPEAQEFIDDYFGHFRGVESFLQKTIETARANGYVSTLRGRRREIPEIASSNKTRRSQAERVAVNTRIQGSAADLIKTAMVNMHRRLHTEGLRARLLLQIHDELVLECPPDEHEPVAALVREEMEGALELDVPLAVDLGAGPNWLDAK